MPTSAYTLEDRSPVLRQMLNNAEKLLGRIPIDHPARIALRTYALALSLSLGPALASLVRPKAYSRSLTLKDVLARNLCPTGFPFAITLGVAGGAYLRSLLNGPTCAEVKSDRAEHGTVRANESFDIYNRTSVRHLLARLSTVGEERTTFACNMLSSTLAIVLLQKGYRKRARHSAYVAVDIPLTLPEGKPGGRTSPTLDLTLLFCVRALDALLQRAISSALSGKHSLSPSGKALHPEGNSASPENTKHLDDGGEHLAHRRSLTGHLDAFTFWVSSARQVILSYFYP